MLVQTSFDSTIGHLPHPSGTHPRSSISKDGMSLILSISLPSCYYDKLIFHHMYIKNCIWIFFIGYGPHITVINHDETTPTQRGGVCSSTGALGTTPPASGSLGPPGLAGVLGGGRGIITGAPSPHQLSRQGSSVESHASSVPIHYHTAECSATGRSLHQPTHHSKVRPFLWEKRMNELNAFL